MNNKQKEALHHLRHFIVRNVAWTNDLASKLVSHGVIPESILTELQDDSVAKHKKVPMGKVLDLLPLRGSSTFTKFCDVLQLCGHPFIADFLRDEESSTVDVPDLKELYKRVPTLDRTLRDHEKKTMETFMTDKIKESAIKAVWNKDAIAREKDKAIEAKQRQLEDSFEYERKEKLRLEEIAQLNKQLKDAKNEVNDLKSELGLVRSQIKETENKFKSDFSVQMKFGMANEKAMQRLGEKYEKAHHVLSKVEQSVHELIDPPSRDSERDQMAKVEFEFAFLEEDFNVMVQKFKLLLEIEKQYGNLTHERNYILAQLGFHSANESKPSLINAYRDFAVKTDEDMTKLKQEIEKNSGMIESQQEKISTLNKDLEKHSHEKKMKQAGNVWQNAIMGVMRGQLNDVKHDNRLKDTKLKHFEGEVSKLKAKVAELEIAARRNSLQSPYPKVPSIADTCQSRASNPTEDDRSSVSKAEVNKKRNTIIPPIGNRVIHPSHVDIGNPATRRTKPTYPSPQRRLGEFRPSGHAQEGLVTQQLKIEKRGHTGSSNGGQGNGGSPVMGKLGNMMSHGLGDLKAMHGKYVKPGHVR